MKTSMFAKYGLCLLAALLVSMGCERKASSGLSSGLSTRSLYSTSGLGTGYNTGMYGYGATANPYGMYGQNAMMTSTIMNPMYDKYLKEARQDRNEKFRQDLLMMGAMKGTELISMFLMTKAMGSMMPMTAMPMTMSSYGTTNPAMMGMVNTGMTPWAMGNNIGAMTSGMPYTMGMGNYAGMAQGNYVGNYAGNMGANYCPTCVGNQAGLLQSQYQLRNMGGGWAGGW